MQIYVKYDKMRSTINKGKLKKRMTHNVLKVLLNLTCIPVSLNIYLCRLD